MTEFAGRLQHGFKQTSSNLALMTLRAASGGVVGLTVALVVQEILGQSDEGLTLAFIFSFGIAFGLLWRLTRNWSFVAVLVFDLVAVLTGLLLRLYVMMAPNA